MEGLIAKIMNEVWQEEQKANQVEYVGDAKEIRIHPVQFNDLMNEDQYQKYVQYDPISGSYRLCGIPLYRDPSIEEWKIFV